MTRRPYDNSSREDAARLTRARILRTAHDLLLEGGYAALTVAALAKAADVSPQTIYNSIGAKAAVLKACYDITLAGDDEPVAMSDRPEFRAMFSATDPDAWLAAYAAWCAVVYERVGPVIRALTAPGVGDAGAEEFFATIEAERRIGATHALADFADRFGLPDGLSSQRAAEITWTLNSPEVYDRLVHRCGWPVADYRTWLATQLKASLIS